MGRNIIYPSILHNFLLFPWDASATLSPTVLLDPELDAYPKATEPAGMSSSFAFCVFMRLSLVLGKLPFTSAPVLEEDGDSSPSVCFAADISKGL